MGKFLTYESNNWRTFAIDSTAATIKRPDRPITADDLLGAIIGVDKAEAIIVNVEDAETTIEAVYIGAEGPVTLTYTKATDTFTGYTNIMINEFGAEAE